MTTKTANGFLFPKYDQTTHKSVFKETDKIAKVVEFCGNTRTVIQAGGNVGVFPVRMANFFSQVYTFEPDFDNYRCLMLNIENRNLNIKAVRAGLGVANSTGKVIHPYKNSCGCHQVVEGEGVDVLALDSFFEKDDDVDLIYLDIEGAEFRTLLGAKELIARCKPVIVTENKGLMDEFPSDINGNDYFRSWVCSLGYEYKTRLMRDDVFVPVKD